MTKYLHCSMMGSYYIDCMILDQASKNKYWILYWDLIGDDYYIKKVDASYLKGLPC